MDLSDFKIQTGLLLLLEGMIDKIVLFTEYLEEITEGN